MVTSLYIGVHPCRSAIFTRAVDVCQKQSRTVDESRSHDFFPRMQRVVFRFNRSQSDRVDLSDEMRPLFQLENGDFFRDPDRSHHSATKPKQAEKVRFDSANRTKDGLEKHL